MINTQAQPAKFWREHYETFDDFRQRLKLSDIINMSSSNEPSPKIHTIGYQVPDEEMRRVELAIINGPANAKTQTMEDLAPTIKVKFCGDTITGISHSALRRHYKAYIERCKSEK